MFPLQDFERVGPETDGDAYLNAQARVPDFQSTPGNQVGLITRMQRPQTGRQVLKGQGRSGATLSALLQICLPRQDPGRQEFHAIETWQMVLLGFVVDCQPVE